MFLPNREIHCEIWRFIIFFLFLYIFQVLDCLADGMAFGALEHCKECSGQLVFKGDAYYCTGDISAWTKCVFKAAVPVRRDWVTPKVGIVLPVCLGSWRLDIRDRTRIKSARSQSNDFTLLQEFHEVAFLKKFKFKRQDRIFPKEAPAKPLTTTKSEPHASASSTVTDALPEGAPAGLETSLQG